MASEMGLPEHDDVRRRAMLRLGAAALVTAAALGGLWWLDHEATPKPAAKPSAATKPIVSAPLTEPMTPPVVAEATVANAPSATSGEPEAPHEPPPPPKVNLQNTLASPPPASARPAPAKPVAAVSPAPVVASSPTPATASNKGYTLQVGVFSNPDNARELVERLQKQGIHAQMETRVQVGPYLNRAEAEKAAKVMQQLGLHAILVPPTATK